MFRPWKAPESANVWSRILDEAFFAETFERRPAVIRQALPDVASLLTIAGFEALLPSPPGARASNARLARVTADGRAEAEPVAPGTKLAHLARRHREGWSVMLDQIDYRCPALAALGSQLRAVLAERAPVLFRETLSCSAFLTPPHATGHPRHYDRDEAFAIQLAGTKTWRLWRPAREAPLANSSRENVDLSDLGPPVLEATLAPGDILYFPRGFAHEPSAGSERSLHATFGLIPHTWNDAFAALLDDVPATRASVPRRFAEESPPADALRAFASVLAALDDSDALRQRIGVDTPTFAAAGALRAAVAETDATHGGR